MNPPSHFLARVREFYPGAYALRIVGATVWVDCRALPGIPGGTVALGTSPATAALAREILGQSIAPGVRVTTDCSPIAGTVAAIVGDDVAVTWDNGHTYTVPLARVRPIQSNSPAAATGD